MKAQNWIENYRNSLSPAGKRNWDRRGKAIRFEIAAFKKMPWVRWPILHVIYSFWGAIIQEGIIATIKPRWGAMTFAYLNDGMGTNIWHVWYVITHGPHAKYNMLYPKGAPKNRKEAERLGD